MNLALDMDGDTTFNKEIMLLFETHQVQILSELYTKSEHGNQHIYLKLSRNLELWHRILLQACLGSDPQKEALSALKVTDEEVACAMFETPLEYARFLRWRNNT